MQGWKARHAKFKESVRNALDCYKDIALGVQEGLQFYEGSHEGTRELFQRVNEHCSRRKAEKEDMLATLSTQSFTNESQ